jgi:hypothetical protein
MDLTPKQHPPSAREGRTHWAGAARPKLTPATRSPLGQVASCVNTTPNRTNLGLKLRQQALKQGLIPGTPRWRAYVLGTLAAAERRKLERLKKGKRAM